MCESIICEGYFVCVCESNIDKQYGPAQMHAFHLHRLQFYMHSLMMSMLIWFPFSASENNEYWKGSNKIKYFYTFFAVYAILMYVCHSKSARKTNDQNKKLPATPLFARMQFVHMLLFPFLFLSLSAKKFCVHLFSPHTLCIEQKGNVWCTYFTPYKYATMENHMNLVNVVNELNFIAEIELWTIIFFFALYASSILCNFKCNLYMA